MPIGPMVWKKIAPLIRPSARKAPSTRVSGISTSTEATISRIATPRRIGFS
jgi:hypothetical protein